MDLRLRHQPTQPYLALPVVCPWDAVAIATSVSAAFADLARRLASAGITPEGPPVAIYHRMGSGQFRATCARPVSEEDAEAAPGGLQVGVLPGGEVARMLHVGAYDRLPETHHALDTALRAEGREPGQPVWEVYLDDPARVPADRLRTEVVRPVGAAPATHTKNAT
ncbi:GyrI-like domain-containing protein [Roseivivax marinus]|uniref:GyrI-like domain-containing protein n=1 Tax=Roseivivax marinus TaxID=1379903 RepID=UPI001F039529|nr:GyrI-like domain-containing protein [Roseivivax marinus]UMA66513.1 GyrI-like domain-containing protein [Roseivivax marinus]